MLITDVYHHVCQLNKYLQDRLIFVKKLTCWYLFVVVKKGSCALYHPTFVHCAQLLVNGQLANQVNKTIL